MTAGSLAQTEIAIEILRLPFECLRAIALLARNLCLVLEKRVDLLAAGVLAAN